MKLLIFTQTVDANDSYLGFFVRWIEEFAKHCEQVEVVCLRKGAYTLPHNVSVRALSSHTKIGRALEVMRLSNRLTYDAVFVHMNPEYLVAAGWLWRLRGTPTILWYMHKSVNIKLRIAEKFANIICTASQESFRLPSHKVRIVGHGIDTDFFTPDPTVARGEHALSVGRLMKSKRHDLAIEIAQADGRELRIAGAGPERAHLEELAAQMGARVTFLGPLSQTALRNEYRQAAYFIHTSETGSLDKVVLEALACGCPVQTRDPHLKDFPLNPPNPEFVREHHSLTKLIPRILSYFA
jgi:glycosyltransferase involved in cell wall biosynthesis